MSKLTRSFEDVVADGHTPNETHFIVALLLSSRNFAPPLDVYYLFKSESMNPDWELKLMQITSIDSVCEGIWRARQLDWVWSGNQTGGGGAS